ncbi:MAG: mannonate dehydratase [Clostridia bacterium]
MKFGLRWYGEGYDSVTLSQIKQIAGVEGVITTLYGTQAGDEWKKEDIEKMIETVEASGLKVLGIESVNIHDSIKIGSPDREKYIDNYIKTLEKLGEADIHMVCYNFMPIFDWTRSNLAKPRKDGATVLAYDQREVDKIDPNNLAESMEKMSNGFVLPGWEKERMSRITELFDAYKDVDNNVLFDNLVYFLNKIMPTCDKYNIDMAIHIDDPCWSVFGLPRIITSKESILKLMNAVKNPHNGVTLCTGSLSSDPRNDIPDIIRSLKGRIHFAHVRNTKHETDGVFEEAAHLSSDGSLDMFEIMKAFHDIGFDGVVRPDHGRMIWGEVAMPGYGLYDRALGVSYLMGLNEAIEKSNK